MTAGAALLQLIVMMGLVVGVGRELIDLVTKTDRAVGGPPAW